VRYYVFAPDGTRFGPADIPLLNQWIGEGRLLPQHVLEDAATGARFPAQALPGLAFIVQSPHFAPYEQTPGREGMPVVSPRYTQPEYAGYDDGSGDLKKAWLYAFLGFFVCTPLFFNAFAACRRAEAKGNRKTAGPKIAVTIMLVVNILMIIVAVKALRGIGDAGTSMPDLSDSGLGQ